MANEPLNTDKRRISTSEHEPGIGGGRHGGPEGNVDRLVQRGKNADDAHAIQAGRHNPLPALSQSNAGDDVPTPPIAVPHHDHAGRRKSQNPKYEERQDPMDGLVGQDRRHNDRTHDEESSLRSKMNAPGEEEQSMKPQHPKLQVRTRPRGRSVLDEIAKERFGTSAESRKERSAAMQASSTQQTVPEEAVDIVPPLSESTKGSSPPIEEVFTPQDQPTDVFNSPAAISPAASWLGSQSPASNASSWISRKYGSAGRPGVARRTSRRSAATPVADSPASAFLRQYSTSTPKVREEDSEGVDVGDYVLGRELGSGGFSLVREAFLSSSPSPRPEFAVKIVRKQIKSETESENEILQAQFEHEIEVWKPLRHANILQLREVIATQFATFVFMPLVRHGSLFDAVKATKGKGFDLRLAKRYAAQIAQALRYLHQDMRLVHRDLKLENCLLEIGHTDNGHGEPDCYFPPAPRVLLADFGLAEYLPNSVDGDVSPLGRRSPNTSKSGSPVSSGEDARPTGSIPYLAPELLHAKKLPTLSPKVDIWAFGVLLYALVTGKLPFQHSFTPKLVEQIKAARFDRELLQARIDSAASQTSEIASPGSSEHVRGEHGCGSIFRNESWARSCHTIVEVEGVVPDGSALKEVIDGCLNTNPDQRWWVATLMEADWLKDEMDNELDGHGIEMGSR